jgi:hypothetical protein
VTTSVVVDTTGVALYEDALDELDELDGLDELVAEPDVFFTSVSSSPTLPSWPRMKLIDRAVELMTLSLLKP